MLPELYHAHHSLHLEDLPFWLNLANQAGGPILELGCGTGRVLIPIAKTGKPVVGIDKSLAMLQFTRNNTNGIEPAPMLVAADMCRFHLERRFSLVILPCNTFSTLDQEERSACLACIRKHLLPGGRFAFSVPNPEALRGMPVSADPELEEEIVLASSGNPVQVSSAWQRNKQTFSVTWIYDQLLTDGRIERFTETVCHHLTSAATYLDKLRSAGFEISQLLGDFDGSDYHADSPSLICISSALR